MELIKPLKALDLRVSGEACSVEALLELAQVSAVWPVELAVVY